MIWQTSKRKFDLSRRALIMGVLNVTSDSFSDGGRFFEPEAAVAHGLQMAAEGADIIDVGGESTRPGAEPVTEDEELRRVLPVLEQLAQELRIATAHDCALSIDTMKPGVARAAVAAGAEIINDVGGLRDPLMCDVVRESTVAAIAMHMQGTPGDMQRSPSYANVCAEIREFFRQTSEACLRCGIDTIRLAFDPGIGFGKTAAHNFELIRNLGSMRVGGRPLVLGASRKSFIGRTLGSMEMTDRMWPSVALTSFGRTRGANVVRVHDVRPNANALRMTEAILEP